MLINGELGSVDMEEQLVGLYIGDFGFYLIVIRALPDVSISHQLDPRKISLKNTVVTSRCGGKLDC
jgi:hypothetical protein